MYIDYDRIFKEFAEKWKGWGEDSFNKQEDGYRVLDYHKIKSFLKAKLEEQENELLKRGICNIHNVECGIREHCVTVERQEKNHEQEIIRVRIDENEKWVTYFNNCNEFSFVRIFEKVITQLKGELNG